MSNYAIPKLKRNPQASDESTVNDQRAATQTSDPYDGILPVLEARAEAHRVQETVSEAMKALETDPELATAQAIPARPLEPGVLITASSDPIQSALKKHLQKEAATYPAVYGAPVKRHCKDCTTGLLRIIRNSDDTVRHVNGEKCRRFHAS